MRTKSKSPQARTEDRRNRCRCCGVGVDRGPFEPSDTPRRWVKCDDCRGASLPVLGAAMLARAGITADSDAPPTADALQRVSWFAEHVEALAVAPPPVKRWPGLPAGMSPTVAVPEPVTPVGRASAHPWEHVDVKAVRKALAEASERAERQPVPRKHRSGAPCGACGVRTSLRWRAPRQFGSAVPGQPARRWPLCSRCMDYLPRVAPSSARWRRALTALALGCERVPMSVGPSLLPYAEHADLEPAAAPGTDEPFAYLTDADWLELWSLYPQFRPAPMRARAERVAAAARRIEAATAPPRPSAVVSTP
jgi:hypothetical protein